MNAVDKYNREIEKLFDKLENKRHRPREIVPQGTVRNDSLKFVIMSAAVGAATAAGSLATYVINYGTKPFDIIPISLMGIIGAVGSGLAAIVLLEDGKLTPSHLLGKALVLNDEKTKVVSQWAEKHPRITALLGRWASNNPQGQINSADFNAIVKDMKKIEDLVKVRDQLLENENEFLKVGITQAANRTRLGNIAGNNDSLSKASQPKM